MDEDDIFEVEETFKLIEELKQAEDCEEMHDIVHSYDLADTSRLFYMGLIEGMNSFSNNLKEIKESLIESIENHNEELFDEYKEYKERNFS
jgi:hypothetical protein